MAESLLLIEYYIIIEYSCLLRLLIIYQPITTMSTVFYPLRRSFSVDRQQQRKKKDERDNETSALRAGTRRPDFR